MDGRRLRIERAKVNRTLFVAKLSVTLLPAELRRMAEVFGEVESVTIIKHHVTNKSKGCGFIKYKYREDAADAFTGLKARNKKWVVEWATSANDPEMLGVAKNLVYVGGLPFDRVTESNLLHHFSTYGYIEEISIIHPSMHFLRREATMSRTATNPNAGTNSTTSASATESNAASSILTDAIQESASSPTLVGPATPTTTALAAATSPVANQTEPTSPDKDPAHLNASVAGSVEQHSLPPSDTGKSEQQGLKTSGVLVATEPNKGGGPFGASLGMPAHPLGPNSSASTSPAHSTPTNTSQESMPRSPTPVLTPPTPHNAKALPLKSANVVDTAADAEDTSNDISSQSHTTTDGDSATASVGTLTDTDAPGDVPLLLNGKPITSYAFITFSDPNAAASAIENEDGSTFLGTGPIRVQYCETPDMKLRKKLAKMRDVYPTADSPMVLNDPNAAASYTAALYGQHSAHVHHHSGTLGHVPHTAPPGAFVAHSHVSHPSQHRSRHPHNAPMAPYGYYPSAAVGAYGPRPPVNTSSGPSSISPSGAPSLSVGPLSGSDSHSALNSAHNTGQSYGWTGTVSSSAPDPNNAWYYVGPPAPLSINVPQKDLMLDLSGLSLDPSSPVAVPMGFPFSHSPTYAPLAFPPMGQLSPLTAPGMPYFSMAPYGLGSSAGSPNSSAPTTPHFNSNTAYSGAYGNTHGSTASTPKGNSTPQAANSATHAPKIVSPLTTNSSSTDDTPSSAPAQV